jgi:hypothetical protein
VRAVDPRLARLSQRSISATELGRLPKKRFLLALMRVTGLPVHAFLSTRAFTPHHDAVGRPRRLAS